MPSHVTSQTPGGNPTTSWSIVMSAAIQRFDILIVTTTHKGIGTPTISDTTVSGLTWTALAHIDDGTRSFTVWWTRDELGEAAGATLNVSALTNCGAGTLSVYRGAEEETSPIANASAESNASADESHAGFTPSRDNSTIFLCNGNGTNDIAVATQACTDPGTLVERAEKTSTGGTD